MSEHTREPWKIRKSGDSAYYIEAVAYPGTRMARIEIMTQPTESEDAEIAARINAGDYACVGLTDEFLSRNDGESMSIEFLLDCQKDLIAEVRADYAKLEAENAAQQSRIDFLNEQNTAQQEQNDALRAKLVCAM